MTVLIVPLAVRRICMSLKEGVVGCLDEENGKTAVRIFSYKLEK